jgi:pimeloyl-ACP methyl ester carboxylesterase
MDSANCGANAGTDVRDLKQDPIAPQIIRARGETAVQEPPSLPMRHVSRPIILLHGFASSPRAMAPHARFLERTLSREVLCLRTSPGVGDLRDSSLETYRAISNLAASDTFEYADVIGHSMGGLIASHLLKCLDRGHLVRRVVTLGTPHRGTPLAKLGAALAGQFSHALSQMRPDSCLVRQLACLPVPIGSQMISIAGSSDAVVPRRFSELPPHRGHEYHLIEGVKHLQLLWAKSVRAAVAAALREDAVGLRSETSPISPSYESLGQKGCFVRPRAA